MPTPARPHKKTGPVPRVGPVVPTHVYISEELCEWAKHQPEGLSALVRLALEDLRARRTNTHDVSTLPSTDDAEAMRIATDLCAYWKEHGTP